MSFQVQSLRRNFYWAPVLWPATPIEGFAVKLQNSQTDLLQNSVGIPVFRNVLQNSEYSQTENWIQTKKDMLPNGSLLNVSFPGKYEEMW